MGLVDKFWKNSVDCDCSDDAQNLCDAYVKCKSEGDCENNHVKFQRWIMAETKRSCMGKDAAACLLADISADYNCTDNENDEYKSFSWEFHLSFFLSENFYFIPRKYSPRVIPAGAEADPFL